MKILAIHSNKIFFKKEVFDDEDIPNFYDWLAKERGLEDKMKNFQENYRKNREKYPSMLKEVYELTMGGLTKDEMSAYCGKHNEFYYDHNIDKKLKDIKEKIEGKIYIFTSYPKELYKHLKDRNLVDRVFGAEGAIGINGAIEILAEIKLNNPSGVMFVMENLGFAHQFTWEPNRYGMLELLIDEMLKNKVEKEDVIVVGKGDTTVPFYEVSGKKVENLDFI